MKNYAIQFSIKFEKRKAHSSFIYNICSADLVDMQFISKSNKGIWVLLCVIDIFSKNAWVILLKDKKKHYSCRCFSKSLR